MTAMDNVIVDYGPEQIEEIRVHEGGVIETVTTKPIRVFDKRPDGSLVELFGAVATTALTASWADVERFNPQQENDS
ncbi:hypothetical protein [Streptomyces mirabilis]|uniref:hypothetical protein n=1 Tax=Streptomyces mirabilis TaxID=68239 RepID=UPI002254F63C|nr:hypothetical protein [Streptomyces mirabilis]MCX4608704.1 hypothetical protein [Streptomyces mirabilis]